MMFLSKVDDMIVLVGIHTLLEFRIHNCSFLLFPLCTVREAAYGAAFIAQLLKHLLVTLIHRLAHRLVGLCKPLHYVGLL